MSNNTKVKNYYKLKKEILRVVQFRAQLRDRVFRVQ